MASNYPTGLDSFSTSHSSGQTISSTEANNQADAINKIEAELGINPSGTYSDVTARLTAMSAGGSGLPNGGTSGQVLVKNSSTNGDAGWQNGAQLAQTGQTPSQAPVSDGVSSVGSLNVAARADHVHPSAGSLTPWGSGIDGDLVFDGTSNVVIVTPFVTKTYTPVSGVYSVDIPIMARNLTISGGATIKQTVQGYPLYVSGILACPSGTATIHADGNAGLPDGTAGAARAGESAPPPGVGGAGNVGAGSAGTGPSGIGGGQWGSNAGGAGGAGSGGAGGAAGSSAISNRTGHFSLGREPLTLFRGYMHGSDGGYTVGILAGGCGGGGGGGDGTNKGGGGGSGGGLLIVNAGIITGTINFRANGGNGGTPTTGNAGGGGSGSGGFSFINSSNLAAWTGTNVANGGTAGSGVGTGVAGVAGNPGYAFTTTWA